MVIYNSREYEIIITRELIREIRRFLRNAYDLKLRCKCSKIITKFYYNKHIESRYHKRLMKSYGYDEESYQEITVTDNNISDDSGWYDPIDRSISVENSPIPLLNQIMNQYNKFMVNN